MREKLILIAAAAVAFAAALAAPFQFDDFALLRDPVVTSTDGWWRCWLPLQTRPFTWFTYWLNFFLHGPHPFGFHLVNWLLHLTSVGLAHRALSRLVPQPVAFTAAAIFAVHPIQAEAVSYVFDRATLLMALFCILSLDRWVRGHHWQAALWFVAALLSKEECVSFTLFYVFLHFSVSRNRAEWPPILAMFACALLAGFRVLFATTVFAGSGAGSQAGISPWDYFQTQGIVLWRYLQLLVAPFGFSIEPSSFVKSGFVPLICWLGIAVLCWFASHHFSRARAGFWGIAAFIWIAPSSTFLPAADLSADRRMYLPVLALGVVLGFVLQNRPRWVLYALMAVWIPISMRQAWVWTSPQRLWSEALHFAPMKVRPRIQLSRVIEDPRERIALLAEAQSIAPEDPAVASEQGRVFLEAGNPAQALSAFGRALALAPNDPLAINNRGVALSQLNQNDAARADFQRALEKDACLFDARFNLRKLGVGTTPPAHCRYTPEQQRLLEQPQ